MKGTQTWNIASLADPVSLPKTPSAEADGWIQRSRGVTVRDRTWLVLDAYFGPIPRQQFIEPAHGMALGHALQDILEIGEGLNVVELCRGDEGANGSCPYRKSNPDVLMVQTSEVRVWHDAANGLDSTPRRGILVQR
jgi:hypothetical protein